MDLVPPPSFTTLTIRDGPDVPAKDLVTLVEKSFPWCKVKHCDRPEPGINTYFLELFDERMALRLCELASSRSFDGLRLKGVRLTVDWPRGSEPWRVVQHRAALHNETPSDPAPKSASPGGRSQSAASKKATTGGALKAGGRAPAAGGQGHPSATPSTSAAGASLSASKSASTTEPSKPVGGFAPRQPAPIGFLEFIPVCAFLVALLTLGGTLYWAKQGGHVAPGQFLVPISLWSNNAPASHIYALGLSLVGCLLLATAWTLWPVFRWLGCLVPAYKGYCRTAGLAAFIAPLAMIVQATVPLTPSFSSALTGHSPPQSTQSTVHQLAAGVFFLAGVVHNYAVVQLWDYLSGPDTPAAVRAVLPVSRFSYQQKYAALLGQALVPVANILHPVAWSYLNIPMTHAHQLAMAGFAQLVVVGSLLFFFLSYARDLQFLRIQVILVGELFHKAK